jgi:hypothetical protein
MANITLSKYIIFVLCAILLSAVNAVAIWYIVYNCGFMYALIYFALSTLIFLYVYSTIMNIRIKQRLESEQN